MWESRFHINGWSEVIYINGRLIAYLFGKSNHKDLYFCDILDKKGVCNKIMDKDYNVLKIKAAIKLKQFGYNLNYKNLLMENNDV
jgi:hypothetical protein